MSDLLTLAVKAHGGLDRWNTLKTVKMQAAITGGIWYVKGRPDVLKDVIMEAETQIENLFISLFLPFVGVYLNARAACNNAARAPFRGAATSLDS